MARPSSETLTPRELEIMTVLWDEGPATAERIREALPGHPHDSSVRTLLRVLESKGYVRHSTQGRAYVYQAVVARAKVERRAIRNMLKRFFGGSPEALVLHLLEDEQLTSQELQELRSTVSQRRKGSRRGGQS